MSHLNSVVNKLVRAAASVPAEITDADLDAHVARILAEEAKANDNRWSELGLGAYLNREQGRDSPDPNAPKPNKRFLSSIIRQVDGHNSALLRQQAEAARQARVSRDPEKSTRRRAGDGKAGASRMFGGALRGLGDRDSRGGSSRSDRGREKERDVDTNGDSDRDRTHERDRDEHRSRRRDDDYDHRRHGERNPSSSPPRRRRHGEEDDKQGWQPRRRTHSDDEDDHKPRRRHYSSDDNDCDRKSGRRYDSDAERREQRREKDRDRERRRGGNRDERKNRSRSRDRRRDDRDRRDRSRSRDRHRDRKSSRSHHRDRDRSRSRSRSPRRTVTSSSSSKRDRPDRHQDAPRPPSSSPPPPPSNISRMDRYFKADYDPRLDVGEVPKTGPVTAVGWDSMLAVLKERGKKRRCNSPTLSDSPPPIFKERPASLPAKPISGSSGLPHKPMSDEMKGLMEMEYTRRGETRAWDVGKDAE